LPVGWLPRPCQAACGAISTMRSASRAVVMRSSRGIVGMTPPASSRDRAGWVIAARRASSVWDSPSARRRSRTARLAGFSPDGVSATPKVKVATIRRTGRRVCVGGSAYGQPSARWRAELSRGVLALSAARGMGRRCANLAAWPPPAEPSREIGCTYPQPVSGTVAAATSGLSSKTRHTPSARSCAARRRTRQRVCHDEIQRPGQCPASSATTGASASVALAPTTM
jgi:hypothetical protein